MILNAVEGNKLPVYGDGKNVRDWLYVEDHCEAIWLILSKGRPGETYNVGGECEKTNLEVVTTICDGLQEMHPFATNSRVRDTVSGISGYRGLISFVADRPGHDRRYAINCDKIKTELGWRQRHNFEKGLRQTIAWFLANAVWVDSV
jgi:dTDP-glucose 4,6-dehydratase